ncbi:MAG: hypothetical protein JKP95_03645 [Oceanicaulis sp.]|nr:hypothetical protein [Oceanicaulis sp.]
MAQSLAEAHGFISTQDRLDAVQTLTAEVQAERHGLVDLRLGPVPLGEIDMVVTPTPPDLELELFGFWAATPSQVTSSSSTTPGAPHRERATAPTR